MPRQEIRAYDYVNRPYADVQLALAADPTAEASVHRFIADVARYLRGPANRA